MKAKSEKSGTTLPGRLPINSQGESVLLTETAAMAHEQHLIVQHNLRELAKVNQNEWHDDNQPAGMEEEVKQLPPHPDLQSQRVDGTDKKLSQNPTYNDENARKVSNAEREQQMEKQLRLGLAPTKSTAPKPGFGR